MRIGTSQYNVIRISRSFVCVLDSQSLCHVIDRQIERTGKTGSDLRSQDDRPMTARVDVLYFGSDAFFFPLAVFPDSGIPRNEHQVRILGFSLENESHRTPYFSKYGRRESRTHYTEFHHALILKSVGIVRSSG